MALDCCDWVFTWHRSRCACLRRLVCGRAHGWSRSDPGLRGGVCGAIATTVYPLQAGLLQLRGNPSSPAVVLRTAASFASWMEKPKLGLRVDGYLPPSFDLSQQTIGKSYFSDRVCRFRVSTSPRYVRCLISACSSCKPARLFRLVRLRQARDRLRRTPPRTILHSFRSLAALLDRATMMHVDRTVRLACYSPANSVPLFPRLSLRVTTDCHFEPV